MKKFLQWATFLAVGALLVCQAQAGPKRILFFSRSAGYEHEVIRRDHGQPSVVETVLAQLGPANHYEFTFTKDGAVFTREKLAAYDAFFFYTTGDLTKGGGDDLPMPPEGKAALLEAIRNGKGFIGAHSATDTFHSPGGPLEYNGDKADPYIKMLGGEFIGHSRQQRGHQIVADRKFPGMSAVPADFAPPEEWYSMKNFPPDLHVLLVQDTSSMDKSRPYQRPNYPSTWAHPYGKGRVFYTSMGHREDVWTNPIFQQILIGGINWALGNVDADVSPNIQKVAPGANVLPR